MICRPTWSMGTMFRLIGSHRCVARGWPAGGSKAGHIRGSSDHTPVAPIMDFKQPTRPTQPRTGLPLAPFASLPSLLFHSRCDGRMVRPLPSLSGWVVCRFLRKRHNPLSLLTFPPQTLPLPFFLGLHDNMLLPTPTHIHTPTPNPRHPTCITTSSRWLAVGSLASAPTPSSLQPPSTAPAPPRALSSKCSAPSRQGTSCRSSFLQQNKGAGVWCCTHAGLGALSPVVQAETLPTGSGGVRILCPLESTVKWYSSRERPVSACRGRQRQGAGCRVQATVHALRPPPPVPLSPHRPP